VFFQAVDRGDVRVVQRYEHFRFAPETRKPVKVRTRMARDYRDSQVSTSSMKIVLSLPQYGVRFF
jgi:hypothetical protein